MTTPEPSSQYWSFFDAFYCPPSASTHLSSMAVHYTTAGTKQACNVDAPVDWSTSQVSGGGRWTSGFCEASDCTWSVSRDHLC